MTQWLLQVVAHITPTPRIVVAFAGCLESFVEDPITTIDFHFLVLQTFLLSSTPPRK